MTGARSEIHGPPEQLSIPCSGCGKPITVLWTPNGIVPGQYALIADTVWHDECWAKQIKDYNP